MKQLIVVLFILNINTAWAHTGHSSNAFIFALSVMAATLFAKPLLMRLLKIKSDD